MPRDSVSPSSSLLTKWLSPLSDIPSRVSRKLANKIDPPEGKGGYLKGLLAGSITGAGDVASEMTSPISLATTIMGMPSVGRAGKTMTRLGRIIPPMKKSVTPDLGIDEIIANAMKTGNSSIHDVLNPGAMSRIKAMGEDSRRKLASIGYDMSKLSRSSGTLNPRPVPQLRTESPIKQIIPTPSNVDELIGMAGEKLRNIPTSRRLK